MATAIPDILNEDATINVTTEGADTTPSVESILDSLKIIEETKVAVERILSKTERKFFDHSFQRSGDYNDGNGFLRSAVIRDRRLGLISLGIEAAIADQLLQNRAQ